MVVEMLPPTILPYSLVTVGGVRENKLKVSNPSYMTRLPIGVPMVLMLIILTVLSCGVMPPGQSSTRNFTVTGFTLPVNMVYSDDAAVRAKAFGIAASSDSVQTFVLRLVMQTVKYNPLECKDVEKDITNPALMFGDEKKDPHCIIVGSTVTSLCTGFKNNDKCDISNNKHSQSIACNHMSISGTLTTTNIIMGNWSRQMWQSIVNKAVQMLASGSLGFHFFSALATVS
ncbi:hypothetical protein KIN20_000766 [Parelaphostrongylus tenuis]|uniref:Uncharacterized protein n=1 Tax=Parelaphostrongylus tenuis TaxID=148309 RepID=A0AAD5QBS1_PARTN|nr:hypothetical protein KIN20_000766 [Parelaphostrongylus tenuis]